MSHDKIRAAFDEWVKKTGCDSAWDAWQASRRQMNKEMGERFKGGTQKALTDEQEEDVRRMRAQGIRFKVIMRKYPVSRQTLDRAANNRGKQ